MEVASTLLEPRPDPQNELPTGLILTVDTSKISRLAEPTLPTDSQIGGNLPADLVAQAEAGCDGTESRAELKLRYLLCRNVQLEPRLQQHALGDLQVEFSFEPAGQVPFVGQERRRVELEV